MFDGIPLVSLTPPVLLGVAILLLLFGRLWTNSAYQEKCRESERWRKAYETSEKARAISDAQSAELLELGRATYAMLDAVFSTLDPPGGGGAHRVVPTTSKRPR